VTTAALRLRRSQRVANRGSRFSDSSDSHDEYFYGAGELLSPALPEVPRRPLVHRFLPLSSNLQRLLNPWGDGGMEFPHIAPIPEYPSAPGRRARDWLRPLGKPIPASRRSSVVRPLALMRSFNRLHLDSRTSVCVRRRQRKQVLFARGVAGRRGLSGPRRSFHSQWSC